MDFQQSNLHVLNYSTPDARNMSLSELKPHLFTLPEHPDWIPYRTSYYKRSGDSASSHKQMLALDEGEYEVCIDYDARRRTPDLRRVLSAGQLERRGFDLGVMRAILRWRMTISPA